MDQRSHGSERGRRDGDRGRGGSPRGRDNGRPGAGRPRDDRRGTQSGRPDRGPGGRDSDEQNRGGSRLVPKEGRKPDPAIPADVTGAEIDRSVRQQLRTLSKENADGVAQHLVMVAALLEAEDMDGALAHAETAVRRAGRVPAAREALGFVAYRMGDFARALTEFRTVRRLSGSSHLLPLMVDCERGLGRPARALELLGSTEARSLGQEEQIELLIVGSGIRRDMGQPQSAVLALQGQVDKVKNKPWAARVWYAYADALLEVGREEDARSWFAKAAVADQDGETDAVERVEELDGVHVEEIEAEEPPE